MNAKQPVPHGGRLAGPGSAAFVAVGRGDEASVQGNGPTDDP